MIGYTGLDCGDGIGADVVIRKLRPGFDQQVHVLVDAASDVNSVGAAALLGVHSVTGANVPNVPNAANAVNAANAANAVNA